MGDIKSMKPKAARRGLRWHGRPSDVAMGEYRTRWATLGGGIRFEISSGYGGVSYAHLRAAGERILLLYTEFGEERAKRFCEDCYREICAVARRRGR